MADRFRGFAPVAQEMHSADSPGAARLPFGRDARKRCCGRQSPLWCLGTGEGLGSKNGRSGLEGFYKVDRVLDAMLFFWGSSASDLLLPSAHGGQRD